MVRFTVVTDFRWILFALIYLLSMLHLCKCRCEREPRCQNCTDTTLICRGGNFSNLQEIFSNFPSLRNIQQIEITGNYFEELERNVFGNCSSQPSKQLKRLKYLDLSNNSISTIHGQTFHCIPNLEYLDLGSNQWYLDNHTGVFSSLKLLKSLNLENAFSELGINNTIHLTKLSWMFTREGELENLQDLNLSHNGFYVFLHEAQQSLCSLPALTHLDLSHNYLVEVDLPLHDQENKSLRCLEKLQYLNLNRNFLPKLSESFRNKLGGFQHLKLVSLKNNRFVCDCRLIGFYSWLNSTSVKIEHRKELLCHSGYDISYENRPILNLTLNELRCDPPSDDSPVHAAHIVIGILLGVIVCALLLVSYWSRHRVKKCFKQIPQVSYLSPRQESQYAYSSVEQATTA